METCFGLSAPVENRTYLNGNFSGGSIADSYVFAGVIFLQSRTAECPDA